MVFNILYFYFYSNTFCYGESFKSAKLEPLSERIKSQTDRLNSSPGDRLKPPPDQINYNRKVIKLNSTTSDTVNSTNSESKRTIKLNKQIDNLDNIIIKDRRKEKKDEESKDNDECRTKEQQSVKTDVTYVNDKSVTSTKSETSSESSPTVARKIKLKRPSASSTEVSLRVFLIKEFLFNFSLLFILFFKCSVIRNRVSESYTFHRDGNFNMKVR